jgi:transposase
MKRLEIADASQIILALHDEIRRSEDARYDHRLHAVLLVAQGMPCSHVSQLLGDSIRTVQNWVNQFESRGFAGLADRPRPGRPPKLTDEQLVVIEEVLRSSPEEHGLSGYLWDGKTLSAFILREFDVDMSVRQSQRLFRQLGFRYRKPRPMVAGGDPVAKAAFKKTHRDDG